MIDTLSEYGLQEDEIIWFDAESFEEPDQYSELFDRLLDLAGEKLSIDSPEWTCFHQPNEETGKEIFVTSVYLDYQNIHYNITLRCEGWFDETLIDGFNKILTDGQNTDERFYLIRTEDQSMIIVFVPADTAQKLDRDGLIDHDYTIF